MPRQTPFKDPWSRNARPGTIACKISATDRPLALALQLQAPRQPGEVLPLSPGVFADWGPLAPPNGAVAAAGVSVDTAEPKFSVGDCVQVPDGRIGRVRARVGVQLRVRVRRRTSAAHQFLLLAPGELKRIGCPQGWMSPAGYRVYLRPTLAKLRARLRSLAW